MKIDRSKWQDEDWDMEDDLPEKKLTHKEKIIRDTKKASIQKKRKEKMRLREEEEKLAHISNYPTEDEKEYEI